MGGSAASGYSVVLSARICTGYDVCGGFQDLGFTFMPSSPSAMSNNWQSTSTDTSSTALPLALLFGSSEEYFYSFANQNSRVMLARVITKTGVLQKTYEFKLQAGTNAAAKISDSSQDILYFGSGTTASSKVYSQVIVSVATGDILKDVIHLSDPNYFLDAYIVGMYATSTTAFSVLLSRLGEITLGQVDIPSLAIKYKRNF